MRKALLSILAAGALVLSVEPIEPPGEEEEDRCEAPCEPDFGDPGGNYPTTL